MSRSNKFYRPRTVEDFAQLREWGAFGLTTKEVIIRQEDPCWRTQLYAFRDSLFCPVCDNIVYPIHCHECGQSRELKL